MPFELVNTQSVESVRGKYANFTRSMARRGRRGVTSVGDVPFELVKTQSVEKRTGKICKFYSVDGQ